MKTSKSAILSVTQLILAAWISVAPGTRAQSPGSGGKLLLNLDRDGRAIQGYDPVAYFTDNQAVKGDPRFSARHEGAVYQFATAEHQKLFEANPAKYAPAFGGYCGYAASINRLSPISPEWFQVLEGRLVLQHNKKALDRWNADVPGNLRKADANWPALTEKNGVLGGRALVYVDKQGVALEGYDPVSYFGKDGPMKGEPNLEATYNGALYRFVSPMNRETFEKNPAKYAPAYGGYCGYAASIGKVRPANPLLWSIVDGQLIVQHTKGAAELWEKDIGGNKQKADGYWPRLVEAKAGVKDPIDSLLGRSVLPDAR
jgi:YHS domain-containing protein